jgi:hypothetical protein
MQHHAIFYVAVTLLLVDSALASIRIIAFTDSGCGSDSGTLLNTVQSNPADKVQSSGCIAMTSNFGSIAVSDADTGFTCNLYSDINCQSIVTSLVGPVKGGTACHPVIGQSASCFCDACFSNPFAVSKAEVTLSQKVVQGTQGPLITESGAVQGLKAQLQAAINQDCSFNGCLGSKPFEQDFSLIGSCGDAKQCGEKCTQSITVTGDFDDTNQKDYMQALLLAALTEANKHTDTQVEQSAEDGIQNIVSGAQVVINDQNGNDQASMKVLFSVSCSNDAPDLDCGGDLPTAISTVLGLVPEVGGFLAAGFSAACTLSAF